MAKYLSNRQKNLKVGIVSYTESNTVLEVTGKVGIGTTNATQNLDVNGNIRIRGGIYDNVNNSSGQNSQVPVADGNGGWSWQSISAAGAGTLQGISVRKNGSVIGSSGSITDLDFKGTNITVSSNVGGTISTITSSDTPTFDSLNVVGISTLGFIEDTQRIVNTNITLPANKEYYSVHKNLILEGSSVLTVGAGTTIILDRFNNLDDVTAISFTGSGAGLTNIPASQLVGALPAIDGSALLNISGVYTGVNIKDGEAVVGAAKTIVFGDNLSVSSLAAGIVTITAQSTSNWEKTDVGIHTQSNVGIGTTNPKFLLEVGSVGASGTSLYVNGNARITGILSIGQGTITLDPIQNIISIGTAITLNAASGSIDVNRSTIINQSGNASYSGIVTASSFVKSEGTSSQFLKADGSVDSNTYITSASVGDGTLTLGVSGIGLTGSQSFTANQSGNATFTVTSNATSNNTNSTIVARDASGNFSAGTITANLTGTATTATNLANAANITTGTIDDARLPDLITSNININSGVSTFATVKATTFEGSVTGTATSTTNIPNLTGDVTSNNTVTTLATVNSNVGTFGSSTTIPSITVNAKGLVTGVTTNSITVGDGTLTLNVSGTGLSGSQTFSANQSGNATFTVTSNATSDNTNSTIVSRDASGNFSAGTITANLTGTATTASSVTVDSVGLGTHTYGDYVKDITGTTNQITVASGTGEGSTPTLSVPNQFTAPQDVTVTRDLQVNRNLNVNGNITIGGTSATLFTTEFKVYDPDIVLGFRTDGSGNDVSTENTANHGGIAIASTEGTPLISLYDVGIGETNPATYKKFMWFKSGTFSGLGTDAWLSNYAIGIGSTQVPNGVRLAAGSVQITQNDISVIRNINASGIVTAITFSGSGSGITGVSISTGVSGLGANVATFLATPSSANLASAITDETGSGSLVFATSPSLTTPNIGTPSAGTLTNCTGLPITGIVSSTTAVFGIGTIELGHATDTTISRSAAGRIAVEGVNVVTISSTDTLTNKTLTSPVISSITNTGTLTLPTTTDTLVGRATTDTFTNKSISGSINTLSNIPNSALTNSTISGVALGSNLNTLTLGTSGTGLSGSTTYNGSGAATFTVTSNATSANTASTIVARDASGNFSAGTITASLTGSASNNVLKAGDTMTGQLISTLANSTTTGGGQIYLNGATGNRIDFNTNGVAAPALTTRSAGTKIVLYPTASPATQVDCAFGIENFTLWSSVLDSTNQFKWYAGTTNIATLFGTGELVLGTTSKTGTASQPLQVTGGAYVSGNVGIGTINPGSYFSGSENLVVADYAGDSGVTIACQSGNIGRIHFADGTSGSQQYAGWIAYKHSTDELVLSSGGYSGSDGRLSINSSGNVIVPNTSVGISTTSPLQKLHVQGNLLVAADATTANHITLKPYTLNSGTLSWEGSAGQLFSITNNLTSGSIFSVNDVSGIPSIDVDANGTIELAPFGGNVGLGTTNPTSKLHVIGDARISGIITATTFSGNLANTLTLNTSGTGLSGSTTFNNSGAATFTVTSNATSANTASAIVARDGSGNFTAGTITAATSFVKSGGTSSQFLKADGSVDTNTYITSASVGNGTLTLNVSGTGLSGSTSFTANQSGNTTFTVTSNATNANTASTIVARDASGNFSAGTITANLTGNITNTVTGTNTTELVRGNMADNDQFRILIGGTATNAGYVEIATADDGSEPIYVRQYSGVFSTLTRTATLLDGSGNTSFPGTITGSSIIRSGGTSSQFLKADGSVDSNAYITSASVGNGTLTLGVSGTGLSGSASFTANQSGNATFTVTSNATSANTASAIVARDGSGNFSAGTITATLSGSSSSVASQGNVTAISGTTDAPAGITMQQAYSNGYPTAYGNVISLGGSGHGQLLIGWSGTSGASADNYIRSQRDTGDANWSAWAKIWTDVNDGSGSGLDADLLDGLNSGYSGANVVVRTDGSGYILVDNWIRTGSGTGFYNSAGAYFYEDTSGGWFARSRIAGSSSLRLQTSDGTARGWFYADSSSNQGFLSTGGGWLLQVTNTGNVTATGDVNSNSDIKLKTNIKTLTNSLEKVLSMRGVEFDRIDLEGRHQIGVIAQEVEEVVPELVSENGGTKSVAYGNITALLIEAIKEQQEQINSLKQEIAELKK